MDRQQKPAIEIGAARGHALRALAESGEFEGGKLHMGAPLPLMLDAYHEACMLTVASFDTTPYRPLADIGEDVADAWRRAQASLQPDPEKKSWNNPEWFSTV